MIPIVTQPRNSELALSQSRISHIYPPLLPQGIPVFLCPTMSFILLPHVYLRYLCFAFPLSSRFADL